MSARCTDRPVSRHQSSPPATIAPASHHPPSSAGFRPPVNRHSPQLYNPQRFTPRPSSNPSPTPAFRNTFASPQARPTSNPGPQERALAKAGQYAHEHKTPPRHSRSNSYRSPAPPSVLAHPGVFNPQDLDLLRAGYKSAYVPIPPSVTPIAGPAAELAPTVRNPPRKKSVRFNMAEPRARAARHKGQMNFGPEKLCHGAAQVAHHARRQKIKVDDFRFSLRRDPNKLGRVQELLRMERELKEARKAFDQNDDQVAKGAGKKGAPVPEDDDNVSVTGTVTGKKGKGKGKRAAANRRGSDATEESVPKKRKTIG
ncbi:Phospholipid methyltransferase [Penicillium atrosanguineum]|uniref:Phospholipid methyltransferase n=1 Tax=Penicillium atrosanguineum TaxID=1132637 RepID=UPI0023A36478|nr:Phospholipid methyltransferase [Penicillium atrosanguineum]KAJ5289442.1 Phospholipid methyltransferase [Penicillium atrosanguineum]